MRISRCIVPRRKPVNSVGVFVKPVVSQFIFYQQPDHQAARDPDRKPGYIDGRIELVATHISNSDEKHVSEHTMRP